MTTAPRFPAAWCATDLGEYRPCSATYENYSYDSVPPLDPARFDGTFAWFGDPGPESKEGAATADELDRVLADEGLRLPRDFVRFLSYEGLRQALDQVSVTACYLDVAKPVPSPVERGAYLVTFLRDQQDCAFWHLYLRPSGETFVVHTFEPLERFELFAARNGGEPSAADLEHMTQAIFWCAPTFEEFAFRFWIENRLWYVTNEQHREPDPVERAYLDHYATQKG